MKAENGLSNALLSSSPVTAPAAYAEFSMLKWIAQRRHSYLETKPNWAGDLPHSDSQRQLVWRAMNSNLFYSSCGSKSCFGTSRLAADGFNAVLPAPTELFDARDMLTTRILLTRSRQITKDRYD